MERLIVIRNSLPRDEAESTTGESVASAGGLSAAGQLSQAVSLVSHLGTFVRGDVGSAAVKHGREARAHQDARPDATCVGRTRSVDVDEYCTLAGPEVTRRSKLGK